MTTRAAFVCGTFVAAFAFGALVVAGIGLVVVAIARALGRD